MENARARDSMRREIRKIIVPRLSFSLPPARKTEAERGNLWFFVSMAAESVWKLFTAYFWRSSKSNEARLHRSFGCCCCTSSETPRTIRSARRAFFLDTKRKSRTKSRFCGGARKSNAIKKGKYMYIFLSRCGTAASVIHCRETFYIMSTRARTSPFLTNNKQHAKRTKSLQTCINCDCLPIRGDLPSLSIFYYLFIIFLNYIDYILCSTGILRTRA